MKRIGNLRTYATILFTIGIGFLIFSLKRCQYNEIAQARIQPLSKEVDVPFTEFEVNTLSDTILYTETGTALQLKSGIFVNMDNSQVLGNIKLKVREFHDAAAILKAGIPMRIRSDRNIILQSAGMIEVRAYLEGKELKLGKAKNIEAELATYRSSENHQLYYLNDNADWQIRNTFISKLNARKKNRLNALVALRERDDVEDLIFELYGDHDLAPELEPWRGQKWKISKEQLSQEVLESIRINWDSVKVIKIDERKLVYKLTFWKTMHQFDDKPSLTKKFSVKVTPVADSDSKMDLKVVMQNRFLKADTLQKQLADEVARVQKESDLLSSFKINQMGIWNIDKAIKLTDFVKVFVVFDFQDQLKEFQKVKLFCIMKEDNSVIDISNWVKEAIYLSPNRPMQLVVILSNGRVALVDFNQIKSKLSQTGKNIYFTTTQATLEAYLSRLSS